MNKSLWIGFGCFLCAILILSLVCLGKYYYAIKIRVRDKLSTDDGEQVAVTMTVEVKGEVTRIDSRRLNQSNRFIETPNTKCRRYMEYLEKVEDDVKEQVSTYIKSKITARQTTIPRARTTKSISIEDSQLRTVSSMLWQNLTAPSEKNDECSKIKTNQVEDINSYCTRPDSAASWGTNCSKILLFSKLVSGHFTVDRTGRLRKVNDWLHVSEQDLRYRTDAIFKLACLNLIEVDV